MNQGPVVSCIPGRRMGLRTGYIKALPLLVLLAVAGCAPGNAGAVAAAQDFRRAVIAGDMSTACSMLRPRAREKAAGNTTCEDQVESLQFSAGMTVLRAESYGRSAIVEFEDDTVFLAASGSGWQVTGAGCTPREESSYDCEVGG